MTTYWKNRYDAEMRARQLAEVDINAELAKMYSYYQKNIENEINSFVNRYALREGIDPAEVRKRADEMDVQLFADKAARYVKEKNFSDKANEELALYNLKMKMSRLELLKSNIDLELLALANEEMDYVERELFSAFQKEKEFQAGILGEFTNDAKELKFNADILVNQKFAGKLWSDRIWKRQSDLREVVKFATSEALLKGRNATTLVSQVVREMNVSRIEAKRLLVTEVARVQTEVQKESYKENDFDKYIYLAEPSACSVCSSLHNKVFDVKDMTPGVNASPMHPHCHCSTAPKSDRR